MYNLVSNRKSNIKLLFFNNATNFPITLHTVIEEIMHLENSRDTACTKWIAVIISVLLSFSDLISNLHMWILGSQRRKIVEIKHWFYKVLFLSFSLILKLQIKLYKCITVPM